MEPSNHARQEGPLQPVVGHTKPYCLTVQVGGSAVHFIPNPAADPHVEWMLRYCPGGLDDKRKSARLAAASVLDGFDYLLSDRINMTEATRRLRLLRAARKAALTPNAQVKGAAPPKAETSALEPLVGQEEVSNGD